MLSQLKTNKATDIETFSFKTCPLKSTSFDIINGSSTTEQKKEKVFKILKSPYVQIGSDQPYSFTSCTFLKSLNLR